MALEQRKYSLSHLVHIYIQFSCLKDLHSNLQTEL